MDMLKYLFSKNKSNEPNDTDISKSPENSAPYSQSLIGDDAKGRH